MAIESYEHVTGLFGSVGRITFAPVPMWTHSVPVRVKGWECPKCGAVYGPHIESCKHCVPKDEP